MEISRYSLRYRDRHGPRWQRRLKLALSSLPPAAREHLALRRLAAQVALPFETRVARDYSRAYGISWRPVDLGEPARRHLPRYGRELLSPANLAALLTTPDGALEDFIGGEFHRARLPLRRAPWRAPGGRDGLNLRREKLLARRLRRASSQGGRVVHLSGWEHLVSWVNGQGLWHYLAYLKPARLLLADAHGLALSHDTVLPGLPTALAGKFGASSRQGRPTRPPLPRQSKIQDR